VSFKAILLQLLRWHVYVVGLLLLRRRKSIRAYTYISKCFFFLSFFLSYLTLSSLAENNRSHRIYKFFSLTYKVLTTTHPPCLHNLISVQPPRATRSSSLVTLARPPTSYSLRITDRSFRYACLWNQLLTSLRQPHPSPLSLPV